MSEIKALERLRTFGSDVCWRLGGWPKHTADMANEIADAIQAEIDERYMLLPVDADGVPIHVGDVMEANGNVLFVAHDKVVFEEDNASPVYRYAKGQRHVNPDEVFGEGD